MPRSTIVYWGLNGAFPAFVSAHQLFHYPSLVGLTGFDLSPNLGSATGLYEFAMCVAQNPE